MTLSDRPDGLALTLVDEAGNEAVAALVVERQPPRDLARAESTLREQLGKLGTTIYAANEIRIACEQPWFVPASALNALRRSAVEALDAARLAALQPLPRDAAVEPPVPYPDDTLSYLANVYNQKAHDFYARHGVRVIEAAYESHEALGEASLMITKHCVRWSLSLCPKQAKGVQGVQGTVRAEPMTIRHGDEVLTLRFDCKPCEMHVVGKMKPNVLAQARREERLRAAEGVPMTFYKARPTA
jgi:putative protease